MRKQRSLNREVHGAKLACIAMSCAAFWLAGCAREPWHSPADEASAVRQVTADAPRMQASDLLNRLHRLALGLEVSQLAASKVLGLTLPDEEQMELRDGGLIRSAKYSSGGFRGNANIRITLDQGQACITSEQVLDKFGRRFVAMPAIRHPYPDTTRMSERVKQNRSLFLEGPLYVFGDRTSGNRLRIGFAFDFSECLQTIYIDKGTD